MDNDWLFDDRQLETTDMPDVRVIKAERKRKMMSYLKREKAGQILTSLPAINESWHIVGNGSFDYFTFAELCVELLGGQSIPFYGSTWTMNRNNVNDLLEMFDKGQMSELNVLTGLYFKRRESAVYAHLMEGMQQRGQKFVAFRNHAKVMLLHNGNDYITIEGSANFTANPRLEQYVITNDERLHTFHRQWMDEMLNGRR